MNLFFHMSSVVVFCWLVYYILILQKRINLAKKLLSQGSSHKVLLMNLQHFLKNISLLFDIDFIAESKDDVLCRIDFGVWNQLLKTYAISKVQVHSNNLELIVTIYGLNIMAKSTLASNIQDSLRSARQIRVDFKDIIR